jgi:hypothetical protein
MGRGQTAQLGDTRIAKNGYHYTKIEPRENGIASNGWILTHWLTAEKKLGRQLEPNESVRFKEPKFKRTPYDPDGIVIIKKKTASARRRIAVIDDRIRELQAERAILAKEVGDA